MRQCPNCQTELSIEKSAVFSTCPRCNLLFSINKKGIKPAEDNEISKKFYKTNRLVRWVCASILGHQWSAEGYLLSDYDCIKLKVCKICFYRSQKRENHEFIEEYIRDNDCEKRRVCIKCGQAVVSKKPEHSFLPDYFIEGTCEEERKCSHCGLVEKLGTNHLFCDADWVVSDITKCNSTRACRRCGQVEEAVTHSGKWVVIARKDITPDGLYVLFQEKRICEVCGSEELREGFWDSPYSQ